MKAECRETVSGKLLETGNSAGLPLSLPAYPFLLPEMRTTSRRHLDQEQPVRTEASGALRTAEGKGRRDVGFCPLPQDLLCVAKQCTSSLFSSPVFGVPVYNQFSRSVVSDSLRPHGLQHARPPCPSPTPRACSNSWPSHHLILCRPLLPPSIFPSIRVLPNESTLINERGVKSPGASSRRGFGNAQ